MRPTRLAVLVLSGETEICDVEDGHLPDELARCEAMVVWHFATTDRRAAWVKAARLRWVHVSSAGVDQVPAARGGGERGRADQRARCGG